MPHGRRTDGAAVAGGAPQDESAVADDRAHPAQGSIQLGLIATTSLSADAVAALAGCRFRTAVGAISRCALGGVARSPPMISAHGLWERADDPRVREQVALFNLVTAITVTFGVAALYGAILIVTLGVSAILIVPSLFESAVGHPVDVFDYLRLAWLASSLATVGGALGGVLESDATVREAAYAYRAEDEPGLIPE